MKGIVSKFSKCTPVAKPITYTMPIRYIALKGLSLSLDQIRIRYTTKAVINPLKAYTSVSTALNQWLCVNANVSDATTEDHILKCFTLSLLSSLSMNWLLIRKSKLIVAALISGENIFIRKAISELIGIRVNNLPINKNNGLPGGWGIPKIYEVAINSPVSQKDTVGAIVEK